MAIKTQHLPVQAWPIKQEVPGQGASMSCLLQLSSACHALQIKALSDESCRDIPLSL